MGSAIAARLLSEGHQVTVWNRTAARAEPLLALGAKRVPSARELCAGADLVISMLTDEQARTIKMNPHTKGVSCLTYCSNLINGIHSSEFCCLRN